MSAYFRAVVAYTGAAAIVAGRVQAGSIFSGFTGYYAQHAGTVSVFRGVSGVLTLLSSIGAGAGLDTKLRLLLKTIGATTEYQVDLATTHAGAYSTIINGIDSSPVLGAGLWGFGRGGSPTLRDLSIDDFSINDVV